MSFARKVCLIGPVAGIVLTVFSAVTKGGNDLILAAGGSILLTVGTWFFEHLNQNERLDKQRLAHQTELEKLQQRLEASGYDFLIKQYADDLVDAALVQDSLKDIATSVNGKSCNAAAIRVALAGIERLQFKGFFSKAGELRNKKDGAILLQNFITHLDDILKTRAKIPAELTLKLNEIRGFINLPTMADNRRIAA